MIVDDAVLVEHVPHAGSRAAQVYESGKQQQAGGVGVLQGQSVRNKRMLLSALLAQWQTVVQTFGTATQHCWRGQ